MDTAIDPNGTLSLARMCYTWLVNEAPMFLNLNTISRFFSPKLCGSNRFRKSDCLELKISRDTYPLV
jgi:hypothetical protein